MTVDSILDYPAMQRLGAARESVDGEGKKALRLAKRSRENRKGAKNPENWSLKRGRTVD